MLIIQRLPVDKKIYQFLRLIQEVLKNQEILTEVEDGRFVIFYILNLDN